MEEDIVVKPEPNEMEKDDESQNKISEEIENILADIVNKTVDEGERERNTNPQKRPSSLNIDIGLVKRRKDETDDKINCEEENSSSCFTYLCFELEGIERYIEYYLNRLGNTGLGAWRSGNVSNDVVLYNLTR